jgi:hypothetical protein
MNQKVCFFYLPDNITMNHTLYPFLKHPGVHDNVEYRSDLDYVLNSCNADILILARFSKRRKIAGTDDIYMRLKDRFKKLVYIDDTASGDTLNTVALRHADLYFKKQIARDRSSYLKPAYGKRAFSDYYHRKYGINDHENEEIREAISEKDLGKLRLLWNLGIGMYTQVRWRRAAVVRAERYFGLRSIRHFYNTPHARGSDKVTKEAAVSSRVGMSFDKPSVGYQRRLYAGIYKDRAEFRSGKIAPNQYRKELRSLAATFSPFGWGEICFRDFEAIINHSALIKPNMSHLETWPNVYQPEQTYYPVDWDGNDLLEVAGYVLENLSDAARTAKNAYTVYRSAFDELAGRVEVFWEQVLGS